jgi:hypothetical protein
MVVDLKPLRSVSGFHDAPTMKTFEAVGDAGRERSS